MALGDETAEGDGWIDELAELAGKGDVARFLARRPHLHRPETVERLSRELLRRARIDLDQADRLAQATAWLAATLGDERCRAVADKDAGHAAYLTGSYATAVERYRSAAARFDGLGTELDAAIARSSSLQALSYLGRYDEAFAAAAAARETFRRHDDPLLLARLEINEGNLLVRLDRHREALERHQRALGELRRHGGDAQDVAAALTNIAVCRIELNDFDGALAAYRELAAHCRRCAMPLVAARADYNVAYLHYLRGEYTRAIELYELTRERGREGGDPYELALCDLDQAEIYLELNLTQQGAALAERATLAFERLGMGYEGAKAIAFRAVAAHQDGQADRALELFDLARGRFAAEGNRVWPAMIDLYQALILYDRGRWRPARDLAAKARRRLGRSRRKGKAALCRLLVARIELATGETDAARRTCLLALDELRQLDIPASIYQASFVLGQIEEAAGDRRQALAAYRRSRQSLESLRSHLRGEELKIAFLRDKQEVYESLVALTLERRPRARDQHAAWVTIEQAKSRSLADLLAFRATALPAAGAAGAADAALVETLAQRREELSWHYREIDRQEQELEPAADAETAGGTAAEDEPARLGRLRRRCREQEARLLETLHQLRARNRELGSLQTAGALDLEAIREALPAGTVVLEYYAARGTIYAAVIGRDRLRLAAVTTSDRIRRLHRFVQFQLSKFRLVKDYLEVFGERIRQATRVHLGELYRELVATLAGHLEAAGAEHLVVVPHGPLHYVPFHALHDGERYLIDRFSISYAPSASVFAMHRTRRRSPRREPPRRSLVLGVPDTRAPSIGEETIEVAAALPGARLFVGAEATAERLRQLGPESRLIHIATHGFFRHDNPMFSAIQLGDSRLTLFDLYHLDLGRCELVVLSGCGTGLSVVESGDELIGLTRGLLYAGARSVLATLWDADDRSTAEFMTTLYRGLDDHPNRAVAVQRAMQEHRRTYPHPYYWAPFVLVGDPFAVPSGDGAKPRLRPFRNVGRNAGG